MKKQIIYLLICVLMLSLISGCGSRKNISVLPSAEQPPAIDSENTESIDYVNSEGKRVVIFKNDGLNRNIPQTLANLKGFSNFIVECEVAGKSVNREAPYRPISTNAKSGLHSSSSPNIGNRYTTTEIKITKLYQKSPFFDIPLSEGDTINIREQYFTVQEDDVIKNPGLKKYGVGQLVSGFFPEQTGWCPLERGKRYVIFGMYFNYDEQSEGLVLYPKDEYPIMTAYYQEYVYCISDDAPSKEACAASDAPYAKLWKEVKAEYGGK